MHVLLTGKININREKVQALGYQGKKDFKATVFNMLKIKNTQFKELTKNKKDISQNR